MELNDIETLFPKKERGIINWINSGLLANVDKEKALSWLSALQTHPETEQAKKELDNAANVVKNFKGPKYSVEKKSDGERKYSLSEEDQMLFDGAKRKFGVTSDIREAGYVLPDGSIRHFC